MRRIIPCIVLSLMLCVTMIPAGADVAQAKSSEVAGYSSAKTIKYAKANWDNGVGDCIAFARLCAEAGGMPRDTAKKSYSCKSYVDYLLKYDYAEFNKLTLTQIDSSGYYYATEEKNIGKVSPGDVIIYKCTAEGCNRPYFHAVIATYPDKTGKYAGVYRYYGHNTACNNLLLRRMKHNSAKYDCYHVGKYVQLWALHVKSKENGFGTTTTTTTKPATTTTTSSSSSSQTASTASGASAPFKVIATTKTNTRSGPSTKYKKKAYVIKGRKCTIVKVKSGWGQLRSGNWLILRNMNILEGYKVKITRTKLNMRTGPAKTYKSKGFIKPGTYEVVKINGDWCKIKKNGYWVHMAYTKRI